MRDFNDRDPSVARLEAICVTRGLPEGSQYRPDRRVVYLDLDQLEVFERTLWARNLWMESARPNVVLATRVFVLMHELGHHLQAVEVLPPVTGQAATELQADCFAGYFIGMMRRQGTLPPAVVTNAEILAIHLGDGLVSWLGHQWSHGMGAARVKAFKAGAAAAGRPLAIEQLCAGSWRPTP